MEVVDKAAEEAAEEKGELVPGPQVQQAQR